MEHMPDRGAIADAPERDEDTMADAFLRMKNNNNARLLAAEYGEIAAVWAGMWREDNAAFWASRFATYAARFAHLAVPALRDEEAKS